MILLDLVVLVVPLVPAVLLVLVIGYPVALPARSPRGGGGGEDGGQFAAPCK